jgi:hypothetical protein
VTDIKEELIAFRADIDPNEETSPGRVDDAEDDAVTPATMVGAAEDDGAAESIARARIGPKGDTSMLKNFCLPRAAYRTEVRRGSLADGALFSENNKKTIFSRAASCHAKVKDPSSPP